MTDDIEPPQARAKRATLQSKSLISIRTFLQVMSWGVLCAMEFRWDLAWRSLYIQIQNTHFRMSAIWKSCKIADKSRSYSSSPLFSSWMGKILTSTKVGVAPQCKNPESHPKGAQRSMIFIQLPNSNPKIALVSEAGEMMPTICLCQVEWYILVWCKNNQALMYLLPYGSSEIDEGTILTLDSYEVYNETLMLCIFSC